MHDVAAVTAAELGIEPAFDRTPSEQLVPARPVTGRAVILHLVGLAVAVAFAAPVLYVAWRALTLGGDRGEVLRESLAPAWRTVQLGALVTTAAGVIGVTLAWLLTRTDLALAPLWRVLAPLPLVFPSFIGAAAFIAGLGPDGVLREILEFFGYHPPRRFRGLGASVLVLTLFTYPLVYLPVAARLATLPPQLEESSRLLGDRPVRTFGRVTLPLVRGAIAGGTLMILLYCLSEFGAVQLLGYDTLTRVVYADATRRPGRIVHGRGDPRRHGARRDPHRTPAARAARPSHRGGNAAQPGGDPRALDGAGGGVRGARPRPGPRRAGGFAGPMGLARRRQRRRVASGGVASRTRVTGRAGVDDRVARGRRQRRGHRHRRPGRRAGRPSSHADRRRRHDVDHRRIRRAWSRHRPQPDVLGPSRPRLVGPLPDRAAADRRLRRALRCPGAALVRAGRRVGAAGARRIGGAARRVASGGGPPPFTCR